MRGKICQIINIFLVYFIESDIHGDSPKYDIRGEKSPLMLNSHFE